MEVKIEQEIKVKMEEQEMKNMGEEKEEINTDTMNDKANENAIMGYQETVMYGRYSRDLGELAKSESKRLRQLDRLRKLERRQHRKQLLNYRGKWTRRVLKSLSYVWKNSFARLGEDWVFLAVLGVSMALISYLMDRGVVMCNKARIWLFQDLNSQPVLQYLSWVTIPVGLILFSSGFVHVVSKSAVGSGIPEMKTILRGVPLDEYLTFRTLVAKVVGLTACLGSGMPLGKEGPFVHIASVVATLLSRLVTSFKGIYENESRNSEMLASACAVGVACSFAAPIGGVLFSIEVTSVYFAVRNYWRGFFAAVCSAMMFRLMAVWFSDEETITALFKTDFKVDFPFDPYELFVFAMIGVASGFTGALYVWFHRRYVSFMRHNVCMKSFLQKNRYLYPFIVSIIVSSLAFPLGLGQFLAADQTTHNQVLDLFSNFTWSSDSLSFEQAAIVSHWTNPYASFYVNLCVFIIVTFFTAVVASTLPVPSGIFIPVFKMGAAFGRLMGEFMALYFPNGVRYGGHISSIQPGGYSIVGAAALAGSVTHTISTSVIVFELTGQITHILPVMIAVLIGNAISQFLQPSIYDSIIQIKKLPYLPDILTSTGAYTIFVEDIMVRDIRYIWHGMTYRQLKQVLLENRKLSALPLVGSHESMILLGSVRRKQLVNVLQQHLSVDRRIRLVNMWHQAAHRAHLSQNSGDWKDVVALAQLRHSQTTLNDASSQLSLDLPSEGNQHSDAVVSVKIVDPTCSITDPDLDDSVADDDDDDELITVSGARPQRSHGSKPSSPKYHHEQQQQQQQRLNDRRSPVADGSIIGRRLSRFEVTPVTIKGVGSDLSTTAASGSNNDQLKFYPIGCDQETITDDHATAEKSSDADSSMERQSPDRTLGSDPINHTSDKLHEYQESKSSNDEIQFASIAVPNDESSIKSATTKSCESKLAVSDLKDSSNQSSSLHNNNSDITSIIISAPSLEDISRTQSMTAKTGSSKPLKPILKKINSLNPPFYRSASESLSHQASDTEPVKRPRATFGGPYATVASGAADRSSIAAAWEKMLQKTRELRDATKSSYSEGMNGQRSERESVVCPQGLTPEEIQRWEEIELGKPVSFTNCRIDPAPFQLVERTTLVKVHSLFSLLGLRHAYVTAIGRLIGVVALKELRNGINDANHMTASDVRHLQNNHSHFNPNPNKYDNPTRSNHSNCQISCCQDEQDSEHPQSPEQHYHNHHQQQKKDNGDQICGGQVCVKLARHC